MRLIKAQSTNVRNIKGKGVKYDIHDIVRFESEEAVLVPAGSTAQRPIFPGNGMLRYNTDTNNFEAYAGGVWARLKRAQPNDIVQQNLGVGDASEVDFGPLNSNDIDNVAPVSAENVLVFVENVFQISSTNYTLVQNPAGKAVGYYIRLSSAPPVGKPVTVLHNFDK